MTSHQIAIILAMVVACGCVGGVTVLLNFEGDSDSGPEVTYSVTYILDGGTNSENNPTSFSIVDDGTLYIPTRNGYTFKGWYSDAEHTTPVTKIDTSIEGDVTLYAEWELNVYSVTYELDGGNNSDRNPISYSIDDDGTLYDPTRDWYTFKGWYSDAEHNTPVTAIETTACRDITLYAEWELNAYSVTYVLDGGINSDKNPTGFSSGDDGTLYEATRTGYSFKGWYSNADFTTPITKIDTTVEGDVTLYAKWEPKVYSITYVLNGGSNSDTNPTDFSIEYEGTLYNPTRDWYTFKGWYSDADFTTPITKIDTTVEGDVTLYAKWEVKTYSVTYVLDGGTNSDKNPSSFSLGTDGTLYDPTRAWYTFKGWYSDAEYSVPVTNIDTTVEGNVTVYAKWELKTYSVTYKLDGGTNSDKNPSSFSLDDDGTLYIPTREGYLFNGWCSSAEHNDYIAKIDTSVEGDVILYAWWVEIYDGKAFTLSYSGKYTMSGPMSRTVTTSGTLSFEYLYFDKELGFYYNQIHTEDGESTKTSKWSSENDDSGYTTTYGGFVEIESDYFGTTVTCEKYTLVSTGSVETQYIYDGWIPIEIDVQYRSMFYSYTATYTLTKTYEVEAEQEYSVTVYNDVGIITEGSGTYDAISDVTLKATVSEGQEFAGWYDANGTLLSTDTTYTIAKILSDTVIYAANKNSVDYKTMKDTSFALQSVDGATSVTWNIYSESDTPVKITDSSYTFTDVGEYTVIYSCRYNGADYYGYYTVSVDGTVTKTFYWNFDSDGDGTAETYSYDLNILYSDYMAYVNTDCTRKSGTEDQDRTYVTSSDKYVKQLADSFTEFTKDSSIWSDYMRMNFVLAFTQYIEYKSDTDTKGVDEYWKFPLETLYEQNGDCEDTSILFCAIASAMGYKSAMLLFYGHMAAGVELADGSITENTKASDPFPEDDVNYYYCETTATGYNVGTAPTGYEYNGTYYCYYNMGDIISVDPVSSESTSSP